MKWNETEFWGSGKCLKNGGQGRNRKALHCVVSAVFGHFLRPCARYESTNRLHKFLNRLKINIPLLAATGGRQSAEREPFRLSFRYADISAKGHRIGKRYGDTWDLSGIGCEKGGVLPKPLVLENL